jgi:hypothetical protein
VKLDIVQNFDAGIPHSFQGFPDPYCFVIDKPFKIGEFQARTHAGRSWHYHTPPPHAAGPGAAPVPLKFVFIKPPKKVPPRGIIELPKTTNSARRDQMTNLKNITFDQKLKAFEIASRFLTTEGPGENATQEEFNRYMDDYFSQVSGLAVLILREVDSMQV